MAKFVDLGVAFLAFMSANDSYDIQLLGTAHYTVTTHNLHSMSLTTLHVTLNLYFVAEPSRLAFFSFSTESVFPQEIPDNGDCTKKVGQRG